MAVGQNSSRRCRVVCVNYYRWRHGLIKELAWLVFANEAERILV